MPVKDFQLIRDEVRRTIRDLYRTLRTDADMDRMIDEAQKEYALLAGSLLGEWTVEIPAGGVVSCPRDFLEPVRFLDPAGFERPLFSWRRLHELYPDFRNVSGNLPEGLVTDFDGFRKVRVFPALPEGTVAGTCVYRRMPKSDLLETDNQEAITMHVLFQLFLLDGQNTAGIFHQRFLAAVNREKTLQRSLKTRKTYRRGRFF